MHWSSFCEKSKPCLKILIQLHIHVTIYVYVAASIIGTESKMKLWDVLAMCFLLLTSVATRPLYQNTQPSKRTRFPSIYRDSGSRSVEDEERLFQREEHNLQEISMEDQCKTSDKIRQCKMCRKSSYLCAGSVPYWSVLLLIYWSQLRTRIASFSGFVEQICPDTIRKQDPHAVFLSSQEGTRTISKITYII